MKLYVYQIKPEYYEDGVTWNEALENLKTLEIVAIVEGCNNEECESKIKNTKYDNPIFYGWGYSDCECLNRAQNVEYIKYEKAENISIYEEDGVQIFEDNTAKVELLEDITESEVFWDEYKGYVHADGAPLRFGKEL